MSDVTGPAELIRSARTRSGLTQEELARRSGVQQPNIAAYERGQRRPSSSMLDRLLAAARPRPSAVLESHRNDIRRIAERHRVSNVRVFGSAVSGTDTPDSDLDLLVTPGDHASLLDLASLINELEDLLGVRVDVVSDRTVSGPEARLRINAVAV
jgi:uncharacterized protein